MPCQLCERSPAGASRQCAWDGPFGQNRNCASLLRLWELLERVAQAPPDSFAEIVLPCVGGQMRLFVIGPRHFRALNAPVGPVVVYRAYTHKLQPDHSAPFQPGPTICVLTLGVGAVTVPDPEEFVGLAGAVARLAGVECEVNAGPASS